MKKRIVVSCFVVVCSMLFFTTVRAKSFTEEVRPNSKFSIYIPLSKITLLKDFTKITDEAGIPLYEVSPTMSYYKGSSYELRDAYMTLDRKKSLVKIAYFGYGYENRKSDEAYFATQYLLYQVFSNIEVTYQVDGVESDVLKGEMAAIKKDMQSVSFDLEDFTTKKKTYEITKPYLVENFLVEGDDINVLYEKDKTIVTLLNDKDEYPLTFVPKTDCNHLQIWNYMNTELLNRMPICEEEHKVTVTYIGKKTEEKPENPMPEEQPEKPSDENASNKNENENKEQVEQISQNKKEETMKRNEEAKEVHVPNTYKSDYSFLFFLGCLGVAYFVFKK